MKNFIEETKKYIIENNLGDNYCVIVYTSISGNLNVKLIYKTIEDFETKVEKDISGVDGMFGIDFQLWIFD